MQAMSPKLKENKISSENPPALQEEKKFVRNEGGENRVSFFSTLTKRMLENPTQSNLEALIEEDKDIKIVYSGI